MTEFTVLSDVGEIDFIYGLKKNTTPIMYKYEWSSEFSRTIRIRLEDDTEALSLNSINVLIDSKTANVKLFSVQLFADGGDKNQKLKKKYIEDTEEDQLTGYRIVGQKLKKGDILEVNYVVNTVLQGLPVIWDFNHQGDPHVSEFTVNMPQEIHYDVEIINPENVPLEKTVSSKSLTFNYYVKQRGQTFQGGGSNMVLVPQTYPYASDVTTYKITSETDNAPEGMKIILSNIEGESIIDKVVQRSYVRD